MKYFNIVPIHNEITKQRNDGFQLCGTICDIRTYCNNFYD